MKGYPDCWTCKHFLHSNRNCSRHSVVIPRIGGQLVCNKYSNFHKKERFFIGFIFYSWKKAYLRKNNYLYLHTEATTPKEFIKITDLDSSNEGINSTKIDTNPIELINLDIRITDFVSDMAKLVRVRWEVFTREQKIPEYKYIDNLDLNGIQLLALDDNEPIGSCRLSLENAGEIGKLAVIYSRRNQGVGSALLKRIHKIANEKKLDKVWCKVPISIAPFFEKHGYQKYGEIFTEQGYENINMAKKL